MQIRSHAQKFFSKVERQKEGGGQLAESEGALPVVLEGARHPGRARRGWQLHLQIPPISPHE